MELPSVSFIAHSGDLWKLTALSSFPLAPSHSSLSPFHLPFDFSTVLLLSGVSVYLSNFRAALDYLPKEGASAAVVDSFKTKDALLTLASSNMIIAVSCSVQVPYHILISEPSGLPHRCPRAAGRSGLLGSFASGCCGASAGKVGLNKKQRKQ